MVKIKGTYGSFDFVAYKTKYGDVSPIADIYSKVSTSTEPIILIHINYKPSNNAVKTDFEAPGTVSSFAVDVPPK